MATSKSFFGLRRGSTKSHTYQIFNGQQVTKDRVDTVKNPRSETQMVQRMILKTAGTAYSHMKQIVDHSFEGTTYGLQSMMKFTSINAKLIRDCAKKVQDGVVVNEGGFYFTDYGSDSLEPGSYLLSKGSASPIAITPAFDTQTDNNIILKLLGESNKATTADDLFELLGINVGDLCTTCFIWANEQTGEWSFDYVRITALASGTVALTGENFGTYMKIESTLPIHALTFGTADTPNGISVTLNAIDQDPAFDVIGTAIHSMQADGKWLRSTNRLWAGADIDPAVDFADSLATYPVGQSFILNGADF